MIITDDKINHLLNPSTGTVHIELHNVKAYKGYSLCAYGRFEVTTKPVTCKACLRSHKARLNRAVERLQRKGFIPAPKESRES